MGTPRIDAEAAFAADLGNVVFVEDLKGRPKRVRVPPAIAEASRGAGDMISRTFLRSNSSRAIRPASMVLPRPTHRQ